MNEQEFKRASVNLETAQIAWRELQVFFASGAAIAVSPELDLVEVALQISEDNAAQVSQWMQAGLIARVSDQQALAWYEADALVWAVVARPYVLVQEKNKG
ncbi:MAG: DUF2288 domain-containing protein [Gammaproteobacteria bacterium]|nr:DUF2288 domain-containing protein [Gammaproteobacteria bacterium]MBU1775858.1 DUF2288 domain-containing protein [Gammaproteobacteria bacterium]